jgi:hypothetical protein
MRPCDALIHSLARYHAAGTHPFSCWHSPHSRAGTHPILVLPLTPSSCWHSPHSRAATHPILVLPLTPSSCCHSPHSRAATHPILVLPLTPFSCWHSPHPRAGWPGTSTLKPIALAVSCGQRRHSTRICTTHGGSFPEPRWCSKGSRTTTSEQTSSPISSRRAHNYARSLERTRARARRGQQPFHATTVR